MGSIAKGRRCGGGVRLVDSAFCAARGPHAKGGILTHDLQALWHRDRRQGHHLLPLWRRHGRAGAPAGRHVDAVGWLARFSARPRVLFLAALFLGQAESGQVPPGVLYTIAALAAIVLGWRWWSRRTPRG